MNFDGILKIIAVDFIVMLKNIVCSLFKGNVCFMNFQIYFFHTVAMEEFKLEKNDT